MNKQRQSFFLNLTLALLALMAVEVVRNSPQAASAQGATRRVCPAGPPACDYTSVQDAVDAASEGDVIKIAEGNYTDVHGRPAPAGYAGPPVITQAVYLGKAVTIQGGYTLSDWTVPDPVAHPTTLNAQGQGRVLVIAGEVAPVIEGLRLTGGDASGLGGTSWSDAGGGIYVLTATVTVSHCVVYGNIASTSIWGGAGGGIYLGASPAVVSGNIIRDNIAGTVGEGYGGGLILEASGATISGNEIYSNTASTADWGYGGGLDLYASDATVTGNEIYSNTASTADQGYGGGLHLEESTAQVSANTVWGNTASANSDGYGGGLYLDNTPAQVSGNTIRGNTASRDNWSYGYGGGLDLSESDAPVSGNVIQHNTASTGTWGYGGGLNLSNSGAVLVNNAVIGNQAGGKGAGFYIGGNSPSLFHTTIAGNDPAGLSLATASADAGGDGSGLYVTNESSVALTNTVLVSQTVGITVATNSTVILSAVLWNGNTHNSGGGGTVTVIQAVSGDPAFAADGYHILANSAAIDAGVDASTGTDIDDQPRPFQLPDLGADEYWPPAVLNYVYLPVVLRQSP